MIEIRKERRKDIHAIRQVVLAAGGGNPNDPAADLVELLRDRDKTPISLVAISGDDVVGHIAFSPVTVAGAPEEFRAVALAPLMVLPEFQRVGIGSMLVRAGLARCTEAGYEIAVVLGSHHYYPRFGFSRASDHELGNEYDADEHFMALELRTGAFDSINGTVRYAPEFKETGC